MKYIRKEVVVDAFQYGIEKFPKWFEWAWVIGVASDKNGKLTVNDQTVEINDWIILGAHNEIWVVERDTFNSYYKAVTDG